MYSKLLERFSIEMCIWAKKALYQPADQKVNSFGDDDMTNVRPAWPQVKKVGDFF